MSGVCSVVQCGKAAINRNGFCNAHYLRWRRYGDPNKGRIPHGDAQRFIEIAKEHSGKECLIWPYFRDGNGYARTSPHVSGGLAYRAVCEAINGPPPSDKHHAAHDCGNGNLGCVSGAHLSWKTPLGNAADKLAHGTSNRGERHGNSRLTSADVRLIRKLEGLLTQKEIAAKFGVSRGNIHAIQSRKSWDWL